MAVQDRFLKYVSFSTISDEASETCPSTMGQMELAKYIAAELKDLGVSDARVDENGYVYGTIPENCEGKPAIGLIAHMDTVCVFPDEKANPSIVENYDGGKLTLKNGMVMDPAYFPGLEKRAGKDLIVTDGNSVLGADDKAGVAEIVELADRLIKNPEIKHGKVCIGFTPDEEIGRGADLFDVKGFGADFAYTVDGGNMGDVDFETFNAAAGKVNVKGVSIHPGGGKNRMVNAALIAMEFNSLLPAWDIPAHTEGYEGFFHLCEMKGDCEAAQLVYIIRDHDRNKLNKRKELFLAAADLLNKKYGEDTVTAVAKDSYYNMREVVEPHMDIIERAYKAFRDCGVEPQSRPVRGGTDGCRLSYMGLPCPNLSTGGLNGHGRFECVAIQDMEKMVDVLEKIVTQ